MVPLMEEFVSKKEMRLWEGNNRARLFGKNSAQLCLSKICSIPLGGFLLGTKLMLSGIEKTPQHLCS